MPVEDELISLSSENHIMAVNKVEVADSEDNKLATMMSLDKPPEVKNQKENGFGEFGQPKKNNNGTAQQDQHYQQSSQLPNNKKFICSVCERGFGHKHTLQNHQRIHTGERPYACNVCQQRFARDHHLTTHMRLHTGERPFSCNLCDRKFVQVSNLRRHERVHIGVTPYICEDCPRIFGDVNKLNYHKLIHQGVKPFSCHTCNLSFKHPHNLTNHKCKKIYKATHLGPNNPLSCTSPLTPTLTPIKQEEHKPQRPQKLVSVSKVAVVESVTSGHSSFTSASSASSVQIHPEDLTLNRLRDCHFSGRNSSVISSSSNSRSAAESLDLSALFETCSFTFNSSIFQKYLT